MAKVVKLQQPKSATVELAEKLLADVKSGKVVAFAVATVAEAEPYTGSASAFESQPSETLDQKLLLAAIEELRHEYKHAARGG